MQGYRPSMGCIECKFPVRDSTRAIPVGSVGFVDGQTKVLIMVGIVLICYHLEFGPKELNDPDLAKLLGTFVSIKCSYTHWENPAHHFLHSLRIFDDIAL